MELPNNEAVEHNTQQCRTFEVIVSRSHAGGDPKHRVGWALQDIDDKIYVYLNPCVVLQDSSDWTISLVRKEMSLPPD